MLHRATKTHRQRSAFFALFLALAVAGTTAMVAAADQPSTVRSHYLLQWGKRGQAPGEFDFPIGIAVGKPDRVFVTDFYNARVQSFTNEGRYINSFPVLPNPGGIALDEDGNLYLTHFTAMRKDEEKKPDRVSVYSPTGTLLRQWGKTGKGDGELDYPGGIAVSREGHVYVADQTNRRVQVFDREGKFLFKWGSFGTGDGQFGGNITPASRVGGPQFVAIGKDGHVFTTEGSMGRVQEFTADGKFRRKWGENEDKPGSFGGGWMGGILRGPVGICVDGRGRLWISAVSGRVQRFTPEGQFLQAVEDSPEPRRAPHGVATDSHGDLFVVDSHNHRVLKYQTGW